MNLPKYMISLTLEFTPNYVAITPTLFGFSNENSWGMGIGISFLCWTVTASLHDPEVEP
jgi:hypothetical protein